MNALSIELDNYLAIRRGFGFALRTDERILRRFIQFVSGAEAIHLRRDHFAQWQATFGNAGSYTWSRRLGIVRQFANWLHANDERHEVPPSDLIPRRQHRPRHTSTVQKRYTISSSLLGSFRRQTEFDASPIRPYSV